jgi:alpha/beta superfamily hydrolase
MPRITPGTFPGPAGPLEFILNEPDEAGATAAGLVCHPHPLYGGTMHTRIVYQTAQVMLELGWPVLRFQFRGVGRSGGSYDQGRGEQEDARAAMVYLRSRYPVPILLAGFSFGATVVAKLLAREAPAEVAGAVLLGLPVDRGEIPAEWRWRGPKLMISGARDEFASEVSLDRYFARLAEPKARAWIAGGDHFMAERMQEYREALREGLMAMRVERDGREG